MNAALIRGDALRLPLRDSSVDLVVTSPPYFALRSYQDGGEHYDGQIGSEDTPTAFLAALWAVLDECWRVLKPTGSVFVNLGDKYAGSHIDSRERPPGPGLNDSKNSSMSAGRTIPPPRTDIRSKSLMLLPEQFRLGAVDPTFRQWKTGVAGPQWIARSVVIWDKPNGLPESVTDRVRRSHEDWVHLTKQGRYFAAVDEIREPHAEKTLTHRGGGVAYGNDRNPDNNWAGDGKVREINPLGKLPGSVWSIPSEPLKVPDWLGVDHFAAYPQEWPRRIILGWSPSGYCTACGQPRTAIVEKAATGRVEDPNAWSESHAYHAVEGRSIHKRTFARDVQRDITGYACGCPDTLAPTHPAVVLDPFSGTGTTVMVARALGRYGVGVDLSADYLRLARWRVFDSGHAAKTVRRTNEAAQLTLLA